MIGKRLQQLRLARNISLEALSVKMGGIVTKQAISKYENDKANPTPTVLTRLASALDVNASYFLKEPNIEIKFLAYRKNSQLLDRESARIENLTKCELENRIEVLNLIDRDQVHNVPIGSYAINSIDDAENTSVELRKYWELGLEPITNVTDTLESRNICILNVDADDNFDGITALAYGSENEIKAVCLVTRTEIDVVRRRLNLTHELGHLVSCMSDSFSDKQVEDAAFRFGTAFLVPAKTLFEEIGTKRSAIQLDELFRLKRKFGLSIQAMIHRLFDLKIINESYYSEWFSLINQLGWRKHEPEDWEPETSSWLEKNVIRLFSEGILDKNSAKRILGDQIEIVFPESVVSRQEFIKLPLEQRRQILAEQARKLAKTYSSELEIMDGGDIVEY